jgi:hypothetical protein
VDRHAATIDDFLAVVESGEGASARTRAALKRVRILDACYASAQRGAEVVLDNKGGRGNMLRS